MTPAEGRALREVVCAIRLWRAEEHQAAFDAIGFGVGASPETDPVICARAMLSVLDLALDFAGPRCGEFLARIEFEGAMAPLLPADEATEDAS